MLIHRDTYKHTYTHNTHLYANIITHMVLSLDLRTSAPRANLDKHICAYEHTCNTDAFTEIHPESHLGTSVLLTCVCTRAHSHRPCPGDAHPGTRSHTCLLLALCTVELGARMGQRASAGYEVGLLTTLPLWQGPGKKENK